MKEVVEVGVCGVGYDDDESARNVSWLGSIARWVVNVW